MANRFKVLLIEEMEKAALEVLEAVADVRIASDTSEKVLIEETKDVDAIVISALKMKEYTAGRVGPRISPKIIANAEKLKVIGHYPRGPIENIALREATKHGIIVVYIPQEYGYAVADHTMALMLALAKKIPQGNYSLKYEGRWEARDELVGTDVSLKTLGIIGLGRIGRMVAKRARGFEMTVLAYDPYISEDLALEVGAELVDLETLLRLSDIITLHVPGKEQLIGQREFGIMKTGALLINTSWGSVVDEKVLITALSSGKLAGAALDVFEREPPPYGNEDTDVIKKNPLFKMENVIATPHMAYHTEETIRTQVCVAKDVVRALKGETPIHIANPEALKAVKKPA